MTVNFYAVTDDNRVIDKNLGNVVVSISDAKVYGDCSIMNPSLLINYRDSIPGVNYFEIPSWSRFYYVTEITVLPGKRCIVSGKEDVLKGNAQQIKNLVAYRVRSENKKTAYAVDPAYPSLITANVTIMNFSEAPFKAGVGDYNYILTVKGGK